MNGSVVIGAYLTGSAYLSSRMLTGESVGRMLYLDPQTIGSGTPTSKTDWLLEGILERLTVIAELLGE